MICASRKLLIIAVVISIIFDPINGTFSGNDLCFAKFDSEYEDACLRGYRMKEEAEKHAIEGLNGVTCENSCSDIYENDAKLVNACKYGCDVKLPVVVGDDTGNLLDHVLSTVMNQVKKFQSFLDDEPTLKPDNTDDQNEEQSEVKNRDTFVRRIRIYLPLGHPEFARIQHSAEALDNSENPLDKIMQLLGFPQQSDSRVNDQSVDSDNQQVPHDSHEYPFGSTDSDAALHPSNNEENNNTSFFDRFMLFVRSLNPIYVLLATFLVFAIIMFCIQLTVCVCRRRSRRTYLYTSLPADAEDMVPYYPTGLEEKKNFEEKAADPKDARDALGV